MTKQSVLVTGVGGGVGQSLLKSLYESDYRVVAADGETLATGLFAADRGYKIPYAKSAEYIPTLLDICEREKCRMVFPGLDAELPILAAAREQFSARGITVSVSAPNVIAIADDKLRTSEFLRSHGLAAPLTHRADAIAPDAIRFPLVLKPMVGGARSLGVFVVRSREEFDQRIATINTAAYVAQECIEGDEYTCGTINFDNACQGVIVMRRILRDGDTYKAFVEHNDVIEAYVRSAANALKPFGACNFQLRLRDNQPYIFEINARSSGTTYCRTLAGFNEPKMIADHVLRDVAPSFAIKPIVILRYWKELVVPTDRLSEAASGVIEANGSRL